MKHISRVNKSTQVSTSVPLKLSIAKQKLSVETNKSVKINKRKLKPVNLGNSTSLIKSNKNSISNKNSFSHPRIVSENKSVVKDKFSLITSYKKPFESREASVELKIIVNQLKKDIKTKKINYKHNKK